MDELAHPRGQRSCDFCGWRHFLPAVLEVRDVLGLCIPPNPRLSAFRFLENRKHFAQLQIKEELATQSSTVNRY